VQIERDILAKQRRLRGREPPAFRRAGDLRAQSRFQPGSGKTSLALPHHRGCCRRKLSIAVIEGDQQTSRDAERIRATGVPALQINTGKGCHLDAHMVGHALQRLVAEPTIRCC
jgi:hydrogenase nickel incorporation protein HypB